MTPSRFVFLTDIHFGARARKLAAGVNGGGRALVDRLVTLKRSIGIDGAPARRGVRPAQLPRLAALAAAAFANGTHPRPAAASDDERLSRQAT